MIGTILARAPTYLVIFGTSLLIAAIFLHNVLRGLRTGRIWVYRNNHVLRGQHPAAFWMSVAHNALIIAVLVGVPFYVIWKQSFAN